MPIGFAIHPRPRQVSAALVRAFAGLPVANVSDCMARLFAGGSRLRPMHAGGCMAGPALTVRTRPGDNLMLHKAIDLAEPGDIIVVDGGGDLTNALMGELMLGHASRRGVGGFVLDAAIRDLDAISRQALPVYAAGVTHRGPYKDGPGEINVPIALGGMLVAPGDLVLGDADGVLAIPCDEVEAVLPLVQAKQELEAAMLQDIEAGRWDRAWVDATLRRLGCSGV